MFGSDEQRGQIENRGLVSRNPGFTEMFLYTFRFSINEIQTNVCRALLFISYFIRNFPYFPEDLANLLTTEHIQRSDVV